jgi:hypothetical protein
VFVVEEEIPNPAAPLKKAAKGRKAGKDRKAAKK